MLIDNIKSDLTSSLKNKNVQRVGVLRMLLAEANNEEIALRVEDRKLTDEDVLRIITKSAKKHHESIELYKSGGREDLASKEADELDIINEYLPEQMFDEDIAKIVDEVIAEQNDSANFGSVMKAVMAKTQGQANGKVVSGIVKEKLG